ncbi:MAG: OmpA family protein [Deltaproteobacteria bacterium]|nr:OmpA family protein [Deltaproteobacteria bacterium]
MVVMRHCGVLRSPRRTLYTLTFLSVFSLANSVHAQWYSRLALHGEIGAVGHLGVSQREVLSQTAGVAGAGRVSLQIIGPLALQIGAGSQHFPSQRGGGQLTTVGGGLQLSGLVAGWVRPWGDAQLNAAFSGGLVRPSFEVGLGVEFNVFSALSVGPYLRYTHVVASESELGDALLLGGGLRFSLRIPAQSSPSTPQDADLDGVDDAHDQCPAEPAGPTPDAQRAGCPAQDRDHDGTRDDLDQCPEEPAGAHPDPQRAGCPLPDRDHDGYPDASDFCPDLPEGREGVPDRPGCPAVARDTDGDGVADSEDLCPRVAVGPRPDPTRAGCPQLADRDGDSVADLVDACPDEVGVPGRNPRRNGCPRSRRFSVEGSEDWVSDPVFFTVGNPRVQTRSVRTVRAALQALGEMPQLRRIRVEGHADERGTPERNMELSVARARNVYDWLIAHGIDAARLTFEGRGDRQPMFRDHTSEAWSMNRRVEFHITEFAETPAPPR